MKPVEQQLKEMTFLYELSQLIEDPYLSADDILQQMAEMISGFWGPQEKTPVRIIIDKKEYRAERYQPHQYVRAFSLSVDGLPIGVLEIGQPDPDQLERLIHEADFCITAVRSQLERFVGQRRIQQALHSYHDQLELQMSETNDELKREVEERARAEESLKQRNEELKLINHAGHAFNSILDLDQVMETVMEEARCSMKVVGASVWLVDAETGDLMCRHASGQKGQIVQSLRLKPGEGLAGWVFENGKSLIVADAQQDARHMTRLKNQLGLELRSIVCAPLRSRKSMIGVLQIVDTEPNRFDQTHLMMLESLAASAAIAIDNARLFQQARNEIEDRKKIEKKLLASTEKYASILENIEEGYFESNLAGDILFYNDSILTIFDYEDYPSEMLNLKFFLDSENTILVFNAFQQVYDTGLTERCLEFDLISKHGVIKNVETSVSLIQDGKKERIGLRGVLRDISHRKQVEVMSRDKAMAESASRAKSQFLACMSHEIRTPLNGIVSMTELIMETELDTYQSNLVKILLSETNTLLTIIEDILDFSKIEAGKLELEQVPFNLKQLVIEMAASLSARANQKGIKLEYHLSPQIPDIVLGDPGRIRQILINLTGNALKFTHQGEIYIIADFFEDLGESVILKFTIKDSGIGIPADKLDAIFDSFTQVDSSTKRRFGGTGLGTTISKQLVQLMQGKIGVESKVGVGSTFWFTLLLKKCDAPLSTPSEDAFRLNAPPLTTQPMLSEKIPSDAYESPYRILFVEDAVINQQVSLLHLRKAGYWVHLAENGEEAVNAFNKDYFDMVLMDVEMPVMDGYEATEKIRGIELKRNQERRSSEAASERIPIIGVTAHAFKECRDKCLAAGMDDFLAKPVRRAQLLTMVEKWLPTVPISIIYPAAQKQAALLEKDAPINYRQALDDFMEDEEALLTILGKFLNDTGSTLQHLRQAIIQHDIPTIKHLAHKIKGSSANLTVFRMAEIANEIETAANPEALGHCEVLLEKIAQEFDRLTRYVEGIYKNRS